MTAIVAAMSLTITVNKADLANTLSANREAHAAAFQIAIEKYRERLIQELNDRLDLVKAGKDIDLYFRLPVPEEHTADFDMAIQMLRWDTGDTIALTEGQFSEYVMNNWGWAKTFAGNTMSYVK